MQALKLAVENSEGEITFKSFVKQVQLQVQSDVLYMDKQSFFDLHIFKNDNDYNKKNSVFDLLNHTGSPIGNKTLISWFNSPLSNINKINERLQIIDCLLRNHSSFESISNSMKNIPNITHVLSLIQEGNSQLSNWVNLSKFLENSIPILSSVSQLNDKSPFFIEILNKVDASELSKLNDIILKTIDFDSSKDWKRVYIRDGFNEELDEFKVRYSELENVLRDLAYELSLRHTQFPADSLNLVYIPQLGYLISLDLGYENIPESWEEVFQTTTNIYFKDEISEKMDSDYGDIYQMMIDLEIEILYDLQLNLLRFESKLIEIGSLFGKLDSYCSLAKSSVLLNLIKPEIIEDSILIIENGRNLIVEKSTQSYIPNGTNLINDNVTIITGANASGKSVYLTQIGIISFLSHIGSYVPATYCQIGIIDKILTKAITIESIEKNESFFYSDVLKMSKSLALKTEKSLLLVDEFGRGTDTIGGPSLLGSIIENLNKSKLGKRSIFTTHFHELFKDGVLNCNDKINHLHMEVLFDKKTTNGEEELVYLYQLKPGIAENSFGVE